MIGGRSPSWEGEFEQCAYLRWIAEDVKQLVCRYAGGWYMRYLIIIIIIGKKVTTFLSGRTRFNITILHKKRIDT